MDQLNQNLRARPGLRRAALLFILLVAAALRLPRLDQAPPALWYDEALDLIDAFDVLRAGHYRMVYPDVFPREPMFITILTVPARIFGRNLVAFRTTSAFIGVLTVAAMYMLAARAKGPAGGLLAAGALAGLRWHVIFSRLLFRTLLAPLFAILVVWAALRARERPTPARLALLGALMASGFYTYLAWWFMIPGLSALAVWAAWSPEEAPGPDSAQTHPAPQSAARRAARRAIPLLAAFALVAAPIMIHYARTPSDLLSRPAAVTPMAGGVGAGLREIARNALQAAGMFHWSGDHVPKQNIPLPPADGVVRGWPALDALQGALFAVGLVVALARRGSRRDSWTWICLAWLALGVAPTIFTHTDSPNFLRTLIAAPAAAALVALGLEGGIELAAARFPKPRAINAAALFAALALACSAAWTNWSVMRIWAPSVDVWNSFSGPETQLGQSARRHLSARATGETATVWVPALMAEHLSFRFFTDDLAGVRPYANLNFLRASAAPPSPTGPKYVIATAHNQVLGALERLVHGGSVAEEFKTPDGRVWALLFEIPSGEFPSEDDVKRAESTLPPDVRW